MDQTFEALKGEYRSLILSVKLRTSWAGEARRIAAAIIRHRMTYEEVQADTKVPWWLVGVFHHMEAGGNFTKHLHNGDPLTGRTYQVPAGRPKEGKPPFDWAFSAKDALNLKGLFAIKDWSVERVLYEAERFNGWGYRKYHPTTLSPYLWSGTKHYTSGKYVRDGVWSSSAVSGQIGAVPIILALAEAGVDDFKLSGDEGRDLFMPAPGVVPDAPEILPRYEVEAIQANLVALGYDAGKPDGIWGRMTIGAVAGFQHDHSLPTTGKWSPETKAALQAAVDAGAKATVSEHRVTAEKKDVASNPVVKDAEAAKSVATSGGVLGGAAIVYEAVSTGGAIEKAQAAIEHAKAANGVVAQTVEFVGGTVSELTSRPAVLISVVVIVVAAFIAIRASSSIAHVITAYREGKL